MTNPKLTASMILKLAAEAEEKNWSAQHIAEHFYNLGFNDGQDYVKYLEIEEKLDNDW